MTVQSYAAVNGPVAWAASGPVFCLSISSVPNGSATPTFGGSTNGSWLGLVAPGLRTKSVCAKLFQAIGRLLGGLLRLTGADIGTSIAKLLPGARWSGKVTNARKPSASVEKAGSHSPAGQLTGGLRSSSVHVFAYAV